MAEMSSPEQQAQWATQLEQQLGLIRAKLESEGAGESQDAWFAGVLERGLAATPAEVVGHAAPGARPVKSPGDIGSSWLHCTSRYLCFTMQCGGTDFC